MIKHETPITVRYVETDQMGIVHHSNYFAWFEVGRTEFIKMTGFQYKEVEEMGLLLPLSSCSCSFVKGIGYEDPLIIRTSVSKFRFSKIVFDYEVLFVPNRELVAYGQTTHGFVDKNLVPVNLKKKKRELWEKIYQLSLP